MSVFSQNDFLQLFVGASPVAISTGAISTLNDGEIGLFTPSGTRLTEANAATEDEFIIVQGRASGEIPYVTGSIKKADLVASKCTVKVYSAATEQLDYIGYNGTDGAIDVLDDNLYYIRLHIDQSKTSNHGGIYVKHGVYKSDATGATQGEIAAGLTENLIKNFKKEPYRMIKFERVVSNAGTATSGGTAAVVYGSKFVTITESAGAAADAGKYNADAASIVAGDYIRIGGTATTVGVYKVTATSGVGTATAILTLDVPYQGASDSAVAAASMEVVTAANAATSDFGIKLTAVAQPWTLGAIKYNKLKFKTLLEDFGTTTVTNSTASSPGSGEYEQMAELEWFAQGNEGQIYRDTVPSLPARADVVDTNYDQIVLTVHSTRNGTLNSDTARKEYVLAIPNSTPAYAQTGTADDITDVLEVLIWGSANGNFTI
jgi:hypothetical protein